MTKNLYCIIGASGSGKTTITSKLEELYGLISIQSYTTRKPRFRNERGHIFITKPAFDKLPNKIAYTKFADNEYCATVDQVNNCNLYVIDPKGVEELKNNYKGSKKIYTIYIDCRLTDRYNRMKSRGNTYNEALKRIINDTIEFREYKDRCNFVVQNNNSNDIGDVVDNVWSFINKVEAI